MKTKSAVASCGPLTKEHAYLGHFGETRHLERGHNWSGSAAEKAQQHAVNMDAVGPAKPGKPGRYGGG